MSRIELEICIDSVAGAQAAERGGANRLELCAGLSEGGITPSSGLIQSVLDNTKLPVMVMIRPRGGSFVYSQEEINVMLFDIQHAKRLGVHGVVFGAITETMEVDVETCEKLLIAARPLVSTFHRAFDEPGVSPSESRNAIEELGFERLLTSGQKPSVSDGTALVADLVRNSSQLSVMPGAGVRPENAAQILRETGAREIHGSASRYCEILNQPVTCEATVRAIRDQID